MMETRRILIVDDQRDVRQVLHSALDTTGHLLEVIEVPSGEEAVLYASRNPIHLLVADYRLPGISGIHVMNKLRVKYPELKVILVTGMTDPEVRREVAEAGADAFFIKPVSIADFLDVVERSLGLVETILPLEPIIESDENEPRQGLAKFLGDLRKALDAQSVLLLDDHGRVLVSAGELPKKNQEIPLITSLMAIFSAGQKVSQLIGKKPRPSWHIFDGEKLDLLFAPLDTAHTILIAGEKMAGDGFISEKVQIFEKHRQEIRAFLETMGGPAIPFIRKEEKEGPVEQPQEPAAADLEPLFRYGVKKMNTDELNAFWTQASDEQPVTPLHPDDLTYEQARQLGLTPEDEKS